MFESVAAVQAERLSCYELRVHGLVQREDRAEGAHVLRQKLPLDAQAQFQQICMRNGITRQILDEQPTSAPATDVATGRASCGRQRAAAKVLRRRQRHAGHDAGRR